MTASTPCASSQRASSTVVAEDRIFAPQPRTRATRSAEGRPKWKLTTGGRNGSNASAASHSKGGARSRAGRIGRPRPCRARRSTGASAFAPGRLAFGVRRRLRVAEEVHVERLRGLRPDRRSSRRMPSQSEHRAGQRAQAARVRHRDGERAALNARHRRLDDWELDTEQLCQRHTHGRLALLRRTCPRQSQPSAPATASEPSAWR